MTLVYGSLRDPLVDQAPWCTGPYGTLYWVQNLLVYGSLRDPLLGPECPSSTGPYGTLPETRLTRSVGQAGGTPAARAAGCDLSVRSA